MNALIRLFIFVLLFSSLPSFSLAKQPSSVLLNNLQIEVGDELALTINGHSKVIPLRRPMSFVLVSTSHNPSVKSEDGVPVLGGGLLSVEPVVFSKENLFSFFSSARTTIGIYYGGAGGSGGSSSQLLLIDSVTGQNVEIEYVDHVGPDWIGVEAMPPLMAERSKLFYLGSHSSRIGAVYLVESVKVLQKDGWVYSAKATNRYWKEQLLDIQLSNEEIGALKAFDGTGIEILDESALRKAISLLYCSKRANDTNTNLQIKKLLSAKLLKELDAYAGDLFIAFPQYASADGVVSGSNRLNIGGKKVTITKVVRQHVVGDISPDQALKLAIERAKRQALEEAGTYLQSITSVRKGKLISSDIVALAAGVLRVEVVKEDHLMDGTIFCMEAQVEVKVDPSVLQERVKKLLGDQLQFRQYKELEKANASLLKRIAELEEKSLNLGKSSGEKVLLKAEMRQAFNKLDSQTWYSKAVHQMNGGEFANPHKAIAYFSEAIEMNPDFTMAYCGRGFAYKDLKDYPSALAEFNKAIRVDPDFLVAYGARGSIYLLMGKAQKALEDFNLGMRLAPNDAVWYYLRGNAYRNHNQSGHAISDFTKAIALDPSNAEYYKHRGSVYSEINDSSSALNDYKLAFQINPKDAQLNFWIGSIYFEHKRYSDSIAAFSRVLQLSPKNKEAYSLRALAYISNSQWEKACTDATEVALLGDEKIVSWMRSKGYCQ